MDQLLTDLAHAGEARVNYGDRAAQYLVDLIQAAIRREDAERAEEASRALQIISACGTGATSPDRSNTQ